MVKHWVFEEQLRGERARKAEMLPDVLVRTSEKTWAVEFGGAYSKEKLTAFHEHCAVRNLPYEVW
jgi:hypothetical protein